MKYKLLKDTPTVKAGTIGEKYANNSNEYAFKASANMGDYYVHFKVHVVENNPEWFEPVIERWKANEYNPYFFVQNDGMATVESNNANPFDLDRGRFDFGNYFKTHEQAIEASRRIKKVLMDYHKEISNEI